MINMVTFDEDKFIKQKDIKFAQTLKELQFLQSNDQFEKLVDINPKKVIFDEEI